MISAIDNDWYNSGHWSADDYMIIIILMMVFSPPAEVCMHALILHIMIITVMSDLKTLKYHGYVHL